MATPKKISYKPKGMVKDLSESVINSEEMAFNIKNFRIQPTDKRLDSNGNPVLGSMLSLTNERGTKQITITNESSQEVTTISGIPIGYSVVDNELILFTTDREEAPSPSYTEENSLYNYYTYVLNYFRPIYISSTGVLNFSIHLTEVGNPRLIFNTIPLSPSEYISFIVNYSVILKSTSDNTYIYSLSFVLEISGILYNGTITSIPQYALNVPSGYTIEGILLSRIRFYYKNTSVLLADIIPNQFYSIISISDDNYYLSKENLEILGEFNNTVFPTYTGVATGQEIPLQDKSSTVDIYRKNQFDLEVINGVEEKIAPNLYKIIPYKGYNSTTQYQQYDFDQDSYSTTNLPSVSSTNTIVGCALCSKPIVLETTAITMRDGSSSGPIINSGSNIELDLNGGSSISKAIYIELTPETSTQDITYSVPTNSSISVVDNIYTISFNTTGNYTISFNSGSITSYIGFNIINSANVADITTFSINVSDEGTLSRTLRAGKANQSFYYTIVSNYPIYFRMELDTDRTGFSLNDTLEVGHVVTSDLWESYESNDRTGLNLPNGGLATFEISTRYIKLGSGRIAYFNCKVVNKNQSVLTGSEFTLTILPEEE